MQAVDTCHDFKLDCVGQMSHYNGLFEQTTSLCLLQTTNWSRKKRRKKQTEASDSIRYSPPFVSSSLAWRHRRGCLPFVFTRCLVENVFLAVDSKHAVLENTLPVMIVSTFFLFADVMDPK